MIFKVILCSKSYIDLEGITSVKMGSWDNVINDMFYETISVSDVLSNGIRITSES